MSLADKYKPNTFDEIVGQDETVKSLKKILKNPEKFPRNIIFNGIRGTGKTSIARVFAKFLKDCEKVVEYDIASLRNVEAMEGIKSSIENVYMFSKKPIVIIFDEIQAARETSQALLLKMLECNINGKSNNLYFLFCTTDKTKLIDPLRSRCLEYDLNLVNEIALKAHLTDVSIKEEHTVSSEVLDLIIRRSEGSIRDALYYLDQYFIDEENFVAMVFDTIGKIKSFLKGMGNINDIMIYPVNVLKKDLNFYMLEYVKENVDNNYNICRDVFSVYMQYKNYIESLEEFESVLLILSRTMSNKVTV